MIRYEILDKEKNSLGIVEVNGADFKLIQNNLSAEFIKAIHSLDTEEEILHEPSGTKYFVRSVIEKGSPNFFFALLNFLEKSGYEIKRVTPCGSYVDKIKTDLMNFPDGKERQELSKNLSGLSHLETTAISKGLTDWLSATTSNNKPNARLSEH